MRGGNAAPPDGTCAEQQLKRVRVPHKVVIRGWSAALAKRIFETLGAPTEQKRWPLTGGDQWHAGSQQVWVISDMAAIASFFKLQMASPGVAKSCWGPAKAIGGARTRFAAMLAPVRITMTTKEDKHGPYSERLCVQFRTAQMNTTAPWNLTHPFGACGARGVRAPILQCCAAAAIAVAIALAHACCRVRARNPSASRARRSQALGGGEGGPVGVDGDMPDRRRACAHRTFHAGLRVHKAFLKFNKHTQWYYHLLVCLVPRLIIIHGDLWKFACEGLEDLGKLLGEVLREHTWKAGLSEWAKVGTKSGTVHGRKRLDQLFTHLHSKLAFEATREQTTGGSLRVSPPTPAAQHDE